MFLKQPWFVAEPSWLSLAQIKKKVAFVVSKLQLLLGCRSIPTGAVQEGKNLKQTKALHLFFVEVSHAINHEQREDEELKQQSNGQK